MVQPVVVAADEGQRNEEAETADGADQAAAKGVQPELLLQEEVAQHRLGEQTESHGGEGDQAHLHRSDPHDAGERGLQRGRHRLRVLDELTQHVDLLVLPSRGLAQLERDHGDENDGNGKDVEGPTPPVRTADPTGDRTDQDRTERGGDAGGDAHG